jgi:hypothetical protein
MSQLDEAVAEVLWGMHAAWNTRESLCLMIVIGNRTYQPSTKRARGPSYHMWKRTAETRHVHNCGGPRVVMPYQPQTWGACMPKLERISAMICLL